MLQGASLVHQGIAAPTDILKKIQWWTKERFGSKFSILGDELKHGNQNNWTDCGIVAANTAAQKIFGSVIWTDSRKEEERHGASRFLTKGG